MGSTRLGPTYHRPRDAKTTRGPLAAAPSCIRYYLRVMLRSALVAGLTFVALLARLLGAPLIPWLTFVALLSRRDRSDSRDRRQGQERGENQGE